SCSIDLVAKMDINLPVSGGLYLVDRCKPLEIRAYAALGVARADEIADDGDRRRTRLDRRGGRVDGDSADGHDGKLRGARLDRRRAHRRQADRRVARRL